MTHLPFSSSVNATEDQECQHQTHLHNQSAIPTFTSSIFAPIIIAVAVATARAPSAATYFCASDCEGRCVRGERGWGSEKGDGEDGGHEEGSEETHFCWLARGFPEELEENFD